MMDERLARDLKIDPDTKQFTSSERSHPVDLLDYAEHIAKGAHNTVMSLLKTAVDTGDVPDFTALNEDERQAGRLHDAMIDLADSQIRLASAFAEIARTRALVNEPH